MNCIIYSASLTVSPYFFPTFPSLPNLSKSLNLSFSYTITIQTSNHANTTDCTVIFKNPKVMNSCVPLPSFIGAPAIPGEHVQRSRIAITLNFIIKTPPPREPLACLDTLLAQQSLPVLVVLARLKFYSVHVHPTKHEHLTLFNIGVTFVYSIDQFISIVYHPNKIKSE